MLVDDGQLRDSILDPPPNVLELLTLEQVNSLSQLYGVCGIKVLGSLTQLVFKMSQNLFFIILSVVFIDSEVLWTICDESVKQINSFDSSLLITYGDLVVHDLLLYLHVEILRFSVSLTLHNVDCVFDGQTLIDGL
jgi:hypothetical protein